MVYKREKIGLLMGSFNPIHIGHMMIANYMLEFTDIEKIIFIVSPQNPFKEKTSLIDEDIRLNMVEIAINNHKNMIADDIEFNMKKPSYTIDTIKKLKSDNPYNDYILIVGSDNLNNLTQWKDYKELLESVQLYVYKRIGYNVIYDNFIIENNIKIFESCPTIELSSTFIRESINDGKDMTFYLPYGIQEYIENNKLYIL